MYDNATTKFLCAFLFAVMAAPAMGMSWSENGHTGPGGAVPTVDPAGSGDGNEDAGGARAPADPLTAGDPAPDAPLRLGGAPEAPGPAGLGRLDDIPLPSRTGPSSRSGPDLYGYTYSLSGDLQLGDTVDIELQINNSGDQPTTNTVTVVFTVDNYFDKEIFNASKVLQDPVPARSGDQDGHGNITFTYTPTEATYALLVWDIQMQGDADPSDNRPAAKRWVTVFSDNAEDGVHSTDWSLVEAPWHITDTIDGDDQVDPTNPPHTYSEYHSSPHAWHCGTDGTPDTYATDLDSSLVTVAVDFGDLWYNEDDHYWTGTQWVWSNNRCDEPVEHAWFIFSWFGDATQGPNPQNPFDYWNLTAIDTSTGDEFEIASERSGDYSDSWYSIYTDCNGNMVFDPDDDYFALNLDAFVWDGGVWKFSFNFHSDGIFDPGRTGYYFDDFALIGITENPIVKDCYAWKMGEVGLVEPNEVKSMDVYIRNGAAEPADDVPVRMVVDGAVVDTGLIDSISPGMDGRITMEWAPAAEGRHEVSIYPQLEGDELPDNDPLEFVVYVYETPDSIDDDIDVLIVDNDHGVNNSGFWPDSDQFFLEAFEEYAGMDDASHPEFNVWLTTPGYGETHNGPDDSVMEDYEYVVWLTGLAYGREYELIDGTSYRQDTFTADDLDNIEAYIYSGGEEPRNLWVMGQSVLFDLQGLPETNEWLDGDLSLTDTHTYPTLPGTFQRDVLRVEQWTSAAGTADPLEPYIDPGDGAHCPVWVEIPEMDTIHVPFGKFSNGRGTDIAADISPYMGPAGDQGDTALMFQGENTTGEDVFNGVMYEHPFFNSFFFGFEFGCIEDVEERGKVVFDILEYGAFAPLNLTVDGDAGALPGDVVEMELTMRNPGRRDDTVDVEVRLTGPTGSEVDWKTDLSGDRLEDQEVPGEGQRKATLNITLPEDWEDPSVASGTVVEANFTMTSGSTGLKFYDEAYITVGTVDGALEMEMDGGGKVDPGRSSRFDIYLKYVTNGLEDLTVILEVTGKNRDMVELDEAEVTVPPFDSSASSTEIVVQAVFTAGEHQHAGEYEFGVTAAATDPNPDVASPGYENSTAGSVAVKQVYDIDLRPAREGDMTVTVDPNDIDAETGYLIHWFELEVVNLGNGEDTVAFDAEGGDDWDIYVLDEEPDERDDPEDLEDASLDELPVGPAPDTAGEGDDDGPSTTETIYLTAVIPREDLIDEGSGSAFEISLEVVSGDGDHDASATASVSVVMPDVGFGGEDGGAAFTVVADGGELEADGDGYYTVPPGTALDFTVNITNPGDANVSAMVVRLDIYHPDDETMDTFDEPVSSLDMGEVRAIEFSWTVPDGEEDAYYEIFIALDADGEIEETDEGQSSNYYTAEIFADYEVIEKPEDPKAKEGPDQGSNMAPIVVAAIAVVAAVAAAVVMLMVMRRKPGRDEYDDDLAEAYDGQGAWDGGAIPAGGGGAPEDGVAPAGPLGGGGAGAVGRAGGGAIGGAGGGAVKGDGAEPLGGGGKGALGGDRPAGLLMPPRD